MHVGAEARRHVQDGAARREQASPQRAGQPDVGEEVDLEHARGARHVDVDGRRATARACVVDEQVEPPVPPHGRDEQLAVGGVRDVRHERHRSRHALGRGLQPILAAGREQHGHAPAGETLGQREADAGRAARDERNRTLPLGHARCAPPEPTRGTRRFAETLATSPGASPWIAAGSR